MFENLNKVGLKPETLVFHELEQDRAAEVLKLCRRKTPYGEESKVYVVSRNGLPLKPGEKNLMRSALNAFRKAGTENLEIDFVEIDQAPDGHRFVPHVLVTGSSDKLTAFVKSLKNIQVKKPQITV